MEFTKEAELMALAKILGASGTYEEIATELEKNYKEAGEALNNMHPSNAKVEVAPRSW